MLRALSLFGHIPFR